MKTQVTICWFRGDLRIDDNTSLIHALDSPHPVLPVFIFDKEILRLLPSKTDRRVAFIRLALLQLEKALGRYGSSIYIMHDSILEAFEALLSAFDVKEVHANHDYEPYAIQRDERIKRWLALKGIPLYTYKDQVIFEKEEVLKADGNPYTVFTPYANAWKHKLQLAGRELFLPAANFENLLQRLPASIPSLHDIGFEPVDTADPLPVAAEEIISHYSETRNNPSVDGTSRLSPHLRFGTISVRHVVSLAVRLNQQWLNELIWREFFMMILYHFPHVVNGSFKKKFDHINWRNNEHEFALWCKGETGYPLVDAGMRQLNETGWMHNRVRMVAASFLTKHLLIDWRWGEAYFAEKLLDYELSSNNGNWQWAAGCGCDAAPYFRIFNPVTQQQKFDPAMKYIKTWIPDYRPDYLPLLVEHDFARKRALQVYRESLA